MTAETQTRTWRFSAALLVLLAALAALVGPARADTNDTSGHTAWEGWDFNWQLDQTYDGLSLSNVSYDDTKILARASLPVMRVYYNSSCGPYSDRLGGTTYAIPWAANYKVAHRSFVKDGRNWLELGIYDRIGSYKIYQAWYLSEDGIMDAHIFSSGLQCQINHRHYPYWRMDFDIDGAGGDRIQRQSGSGWINQTTEFDAAGSTTYRVVDGATSVHIQPGATDWSIPPGFGDTDPGNASNDLALFGRRAASVPANDFTSMFTTGQEGQERPRSSGGSIDGTDVAVVYRARMPHAATDGPTLWHSAGPRFRISSEVSSNNPPIAAATATPSRGTAPLPVRFSSAGSSDPDGDQLTYAWSFGDGATSQAANPSHTYSAGGTYTATLIVRDSNGGADTASARITVSDPVGNTAPTASASASPLSGIAPLVVRFSSAGSSDPDGDALTYRWNFGDGSISTAANPSHTYNAAGNYVASVTVRDNSGASAEASVRVSVSAPPTTRPQPRKIHIWGRRKPNDTRSTRWVNAGGRVRMPAGYACSGRVRVRLYGTSRVIAEKFVTLDPSDTRCRYRARRLSIARAGNATTLRVQTRFLGTTAVAPMNSPLVNVQINR